MEVGRKFRKWGLFLQPEEVTPPFELNWMRDYLARSQAINPPLDIDRRDGFRRGVVEPAIHALHLSLLRDERKLSPAIADRRRQLREKAISRGPDALTPREKKVLLSDPAGLRALHREVWELTDEALAKNWGLTLPREPLSHA
jgi:membrane glycosyltransferase